MKYFTLYLIILIIAPNATGQQKSVDFTLGFPEEKVAASVYNSIEMIDSRIDTTHLGVVQLGAFNRKAWVIPQQHLSTQIKQLLQSLTNEDGSPGKLLLHLRHFNFAEITGATKERGYCHLKADLYAANGSRYVVLNRIDTVAIIKGLDVTRSMFRKGSQLLTDLIRTSLHRTPSQTDDYSYNDVLNMDEIEKRKLPAYTTPEFANGVYRTYEMFSDQKPETNAQIEMKNGQIRAVKVIDSIGAISKLKPRDIYAVVHEGRAWIATEFGYYPLEKAGNDFLFTGKAKVSANTGDVLTASVFFGLIGGLIASAADATFLMKIDHNTGGFIRLREVKDQNNSN